MSHFAYVIRVLRHALHYNKMTFCVLARVINASGTRMPSLHVHTTIATQPKRHKTDTVLTVDMDSTHPAAFPVKHLFQTTY